jgi:hypothetical protein
LRCLCGWERAAEVPEESVFSRAFSEFARTEFAQRVHAALIQRTQGERLVGHILRDATAIEVREKPAPKPPAEAAPRARRLHRKGGAAKRPEQMTRIERQSSGTMTLAEMMAELPRGCKVGCKPNSKGVREYWRGYKLHLDVADGQIPISCVLTSASLNDNQVAIPLALLTAERATSCYDLMDAGYDSEAIRSHSRGLGHAPIIPHQKHGTVEVEMAPHEKGPLPGTHHSRARLLAPEGGVRRTAGAREGLGEGDDASDVRHLSSDRRPDPTMVGYQATAESVGRPLRRAHRAQKFQRKRDCWIEVCPPVCLHRLSNGSEREIDVAERPNGPDRLAEPFFCK